MNIISEISFFNRKRLHLYHLRKQVLQESLTFYIKNTNTNTSPKGCAIHSAGHGSLLHPSVSDGLAPEHRLLSTSYSIPFADLWTHRTLRLLNPPLHVLLQSPQ